MLTIENENEGGAEFENRAFLDSNHRYRKLDWTNERFPIDSSWRTDWSELNHGNESLLNPPLPVNRHHKASEWFAKSLPMFSTSAPYISNPYPTLLIYITWFFPGQSVHGSQYIQNTRAALVCVVCACQHIFQSAAEVWSLFILTPWTLHLAVATQDRNRGTRLRCAV